MSLLFIHLFRSVHRAFFIVSRPLHCNCYFKRKTRLALLLNHYIPRCPFYCTYFAFRRTGVHPPYTFR